MNSTVTVDGDEMVPSRSSGKRKHSGMVEEEAFTYVQHVTPPLSIETDGLAVLGQIVLQQTCKVLSDFNEEQYQQKMVFRHRRVKQYKGNPFPKSQHSFASQAQPTIYPGKLLNKSVALIAPADSIYHNLNALGTNKQPEDTSHDCLGYNDRIILDKLLSEDLAEAWPAPFGLWELCFLLNVLDKGLTKSKVIRELKPRVQLLHVELKKILGFAKNARDGGDAAFKEHIFQPCRVLLGIGNDMSTHIGDTDKSTMAVVLQIQAAYRRDPNEQSMLELADMLLETKGLAYATRFSLFLRRLEGRPFEVDEFDSGLEELWAKLFGEPYTPERQTPADEVH